MPLLSWLGRGVSFFKGQPIFGESTFPGPIPMQRGGNTAFQAIFTTPGTFTWIAPANVYSVTVTEQGSGSSGQAGQTTTGGVGGGSGALNATGVIGVTPGVTYNGRVGEPDQGSSTSNSQFVGDTLTITAHGTIFQTGGTTSPSVGGSTPTAGSAGANANLTTGGNGGDAPGRSGTGGVGGVANSPGGAGTIYGAGGGGGGTPTEVGGQGQGGFVLLTWTPTPPSGAPSLDFSQASNSMYIGAIL